MNRSLQETGFNFRYLKINIFNFSLISDRLPLSQLMKRIKQKYMFYFSN